MNTIYILWLRQLKKYFRSRSRIIGSLGQPILFLVAFGFGFGSIYQKANGGNYIQFLAPGIILMGVLFTAVFSGIELIWDRQFGFLKETMVAPVSRFNIMLGRTLGGATVASIQGLIVFLLTLIIGFRPQNFLMVPIAFIFIFLTALLFTSLGTAIASLLEDMQGFQLIMNFLVMPIFFLSGALFPLKGVPKIMEIIAKADPLTYGIDGVRGSLISNSTYGIVNDFLILSVVTICILGIGSYLFEKIQI
ncbi:MAG TPA: ABC transporter permease [Candidatus Saccharimonadales bacterium]|nr:ABC transporter permease [Candidatus Saccharimonadales bacterium]